MALANSKILVKAHRAWVFSFAMNISVCKEIGDQSDKVESSWNKIEVQNIWKYVSEWVIWSFSRLRQLNEALSNR